MKTKQAKRLLALFIIIAVCAAVFNADFNDLKDQAFSADVYADYDSVTSTTPYENITGGTLYFKTTKNGDAHVIAILINDASVTSINIPTRVFNRRTNSTTSYPVTTITSYAFGEISQQNPSVRIKSVTLPNTITTLQQYAFVGLDYLEKIIIPSKVTELPKGAFSGCSRLKEITLPAGLLKVYNDVFYNCSSLEKLTIPAGVTDFGNTVFKNCTSLKTVAFLGNCPTTTSSANVFVGCTSYQYTTYLAGKTGWPGSWWGYPCRMVGSEVVSENESEEVSEEASEKVSEEVSEPTTQTIETESDDETVEMPTEEETEPTTFIYDNNGFAGYYDDMGNYIEVYQPCEYDSENNAYHITNAGNLYWFADYINSSLGMDNLMGGILDNDITVNWGKIDGTNPYVRKWIPIGAAGAGGEFGSFAGVFNGNSHIINGLYCASDDENIYNYSGLFGYLTESAKVMNVCVENSYFKAASTGAVAASSNGSMENCLSVNNTIVATINAGGVLGVAMENSSIDGCFCMNSEISMHSNGENVPFANGIIGYTANIAKNCLFHNVKITKETGEAADKWNGVTEIPDGDANLDGKVNSIDSIASQWLTYSQYNIASCAADMNNDHIINEVDTAYILKAIFTQDHSDEENAEESTQQ